ncbi:MAG: Holliday junction resolvase RuvX [Phycisphaerae bacterium]|nr:Holliday junction resolvase RuvX [Phycisphaerae bacterium]
MRYLAVDLGQKRTGLATGDDITGLVQPYDVVQVPPGPRLFAELAKAIDDIGPDAVIVGLPLNMDGSDGPAATSARAFGTELGTRAKVRIEFQDERLTSFAAEEGLNRSGRTHQQKKELRDALAAAEILRDYLRRVSRESNDTTLDPDTGREASPGIDDSRS